jgi:hypothetical protein
MSVTYLKHIVKITQNLNDMELEYENESEYDIDINFLNDSDFEFDIKEIIPPPWPVPNMNPVKMVTPPTLRDHNVNPVDMDLLPTPSNQEISPTYHEDMRKLLTKLNLQMETLINTMNNFVSNNTK